VKPSRGPPSQPSLSSMKACKKVMEISHAALLYIGISDEPLWYL
jgi:hypothetical protein